MKSLIIYYSYSGNTARMAKLLQKALDADIASIETVRPYTGSYNEIVNQGEREINGGFMPEIKPISVDLSTYDTILLGTPVWWYTFAPAMKTFLHQYDLTGKTIYPFATNGGWLGRTLKDFEKACKGAQVKSGLDIRFDEDILRTDEHTILQWAKQISWGHD